ncbi:MAG: hypothetical protein FJ358_07060 [Thaumarchaeota archaeon]|nr:hypothetical protein [Nitrososphaerota archaeon]
MVFGLRKDSKMEEIYKKGTAEGLLQGYLKAKEEMEGRIRDLESKVESFKTVELEVETLCVQLKTAQDQINLLGRLNRLTKDEA